MNTRFIGAGLGLLVLAAAIAFFGIPVAIKTGSLYPDADPTRIGCYTSGVSGELVDDPSAGTAIIDGMSGRRTLVTWPIGWTGRNSLFGTSVINSRGEVIARTGTHVNLSGGYWTDGSFLACGEVH